MYQLRGYSSRCGKSCIYIHKCIHGDATRFSKSTRRSWNERYFEISILNFIIDKKKLTKFYKRFIVLTCQGHFPNELRIPPTIRDSGNILLPHTARTSIVEFNPFNKFMNLNDTAMLGKRVFYIRPTG